MGSLAETIAQKLTECPATAAALGNQPPEVIENLKRSWAAIVDAELFESGDPNASSDPQQPDSPWAGAQGNGKKKKNGNGK